MRSATGKTLVSLGIGLITAVIVHITILKWGMLLNGGGIISLFMRVLVPATLLLYPGLALLRMNEAITFRQSYAKVFRIYTWLPIAVLLVFCVILAIAPILDHKSTHFGALPELAGWGAAVCVLYATVGAVLKPYRVFPRWLAVSLLIILAVVVCAYLLFGSVIWAPLAGS